jgi:hypothetical protein
MKGLNMGPGIAVETFQRFTLLGPRWFFRIVDTGNSEILAQSQSYKSPYQRDITAKRMAAALGTKVVKGARK